MLLDVILLDIFPRYDPVLIGFVIINIDMNKVILSMCIYSTLLCSCGLGAFERNQGCIIYFCQVVDLYIPFEIPVKCQRPQ